MTENNYYNNKKRKASRDLNDKDQLFTIGSFIVDVSPTIESNTATLSLDNTSIDLVQTQYRGHLELPDRDLNPVVQFNTNGYNYATALDIDVSNVDISPPSTDVNDNEISVSIPADPNWVDDDDAEGIVNIDDFLNNELVNDNQFDERYATSINIDLSAFREQCYKDMQLQSNENETKSSTIPFEIKSNGTYTIGDFDNVEGQEIVKDNQNRKGKMTIVKSDSIKNTKDVESTPFKPPNVGTFVVNVPEPQPKSTTKSIEINEIQNGVSTVYSPSEDGDYEYYSSVTVVNNTQSKIGNPVLGSYNTNNQTISITTDDVNTHPYVNRGDLTIPLEDKTVEYMVGGNLPSVNVSNGYYGIKSITYSPITSGDECIRLFEGVTINDVVSRVNTEIGQTEALNTIVYNNKYYTLSSGATTEELLGLVTGNTYESKGVYKTAYFYVWSDIPFVLNSFISNVLWSEQQLYGSNDGISWVNLTDVFWSEDDTPKHYPNLTLAWKFYRLRLYRDGTVYINKFIPMFCRESSYNYENLLLENNKQLTITTQDSNTTIYLNPSVGYDGFSNAIITVPRFENVNNFTDYNSNNPFQIEYSESNTTGVITIPEGYTGLGEIHFEIVKAKKRAVKYGLTYNNWKGLISDMLNAGGQYKIHRYHGEGNTTQVFINPTTNQVISLASSGDSWNMYVPATFKHAELSTGNNDTTNYSLCLYDENDNVIYSLRNQIGSSGSYTKYVNTVPSDIKIVV